VLNSYSVTLNFLKIPETTTIGLSYLSRHCVHVHVYLCIISRRTEWICWTSRAPWSASRTIVSATPLPVQHICPTWSGYSTTSRPTKAGCWFQYRVESNTRPSRRRIRRASWGGLGTGTTPVWCFPKNWRKKHTHARMRYITI